MPLINTLCVGLNYQVCLPILADIYSMIFARRGDVKHGKIRLMLGLPSMTFIKHPLKHNAPLLPNRMVVLTPNTPQSGVSRLYKSLTY